MNQEWPMQNSEIPKPAESEQNLEQELSPETEVAVLHKIEDILAYGTPFSQVAQIGNEEGFKENINIIRSVLKNGLLGANKYFRDRLTNPIELWKKHINDEKEAVVYFNMIGRFRDNGGANISSSIWGSGSGTICVIFDLSKFDETMPRERWQGRGDKSSFRTYWRDGHDGADWKTRYGDRTLEEIKKEKNLHDGMIFNSQGDTTAHSEFGFTLSPRVAPRMFKGLVVTTYGEKNDRILERLQEVIKLQLEEYSNRPDLIIPIYDDNGNLLWPRQMSYEEVRKFVEKRDMENTN